MCLQGCYLHSEAFTCGFLLFFSIQMRDQIGFLLDKCVFTVFIQNPMTCIICILKKVLKLSLHCILKNAFSSSCYRYSVCSILHSFYWKSWSSFIFFGCRWKDLIKIIGLTCEITVLEKGMYPFKGISIKIAHLFIMFQNQPLVSLPQVTIDFSGFKLIALSLACRDQY